MDICLIMDNPETPHHPVIGKVLQELGATHSVSLLDVRGLSDAEALQLVQEKPLAKLYLLKSHAPQALAIARYLEQQGVLVVNSWASSMACQDRVLMAQRMREAQLPWPSTQHFSSLAHLLAQQSQLATLSFPLIIKSYYSHRGDLVAKVDTLEQLQVLATQWGEEPIILQEFAQSDGWDIKIWVIDQEVFAARRRTPLEADAPKEDIPLTANELPADWRHIALEIGRVFNMHLYGVDLLVTAQGAIIVDVNGFPGFRGVPGAASALVELVQRLITERQVVA
ncbi:MAG: ATP-grasp domain-containing protein [Ktedonobacteraceae bacterium]